MDWMRRVRMVGLSFAVLLLLGAVPAWAGTTHGSGLVTAKSGAPPTLIVDDEVTVRVTPETQLVDPAGNRVSFASIPVAGAPGAGGGAMVDYSGTEDGHVVTADRIVVRLVTE